MSTQTITTVPGRLPVSAALVNKGSDLPDIMSKADADDLYKLYKECHAGRGLDENFLSAIHQILIATDTRNPNGGMPNIDARTYKFAKAVLNYVASELNQRNPDKSKPVKVEESRDAAGFERLALNTSSLFLMDRHELAQYVAYSAGKILGFEDKKLLKAIAGLKNNKFIGDFNLHALDADLILMLSECAQPDGGIRITQEDIRRMADEPITLAGYAKGLNEIFANVLAEPLSLSKNEDGSPILSISKKHADHLRFLVDMTSKAVGLSADPSKPMRLETWGEASDLAHIPSESKYDELRLVLSTMYATAVSTAGGKENGFLCPHKSNSEVLSAIQLVNPYIAGKANIQKDGYVALSPSHTRIISNILTQLVATLRNKGADAAVEKLHELRAQGKSDSVGRTQSSSGNNSQKACSGDSEDAVNEFMLPLAGIDVLYDVCERLHKVVHNTDGARDGVHNKYLASKGLYSLKFDNEAGAEHAQALLRKLLQDGKAIEVATHIEKHKPEYWLEVPSDLAARALSEMNALSGMCHDIAVKFNSGDVEAAELLRSHLISLLEEGMELNPQSYVATERARRAAGARTEIAAGV